jgi:hypothetical protein
VNRKTIAGTSIGLVVGLVLGIAISVILNFPSLNTTGAGTSNQVQASGNLQNIQTGTIYFLQLTKFYDDDAIKSSSPIVNGDYTVLLVGGQSYDIFVNRYPDYSDEDPDYTLYVPQGVATYTANF